MGNRSRTTGVRELACDVMPRCVPIGSLSPGRGIASRWTHPFSSIRASGGAKTPPGTDSMILPGRTSISRSHHLRRSVHPAASAASQQCLFVDRVHVTLRHTLCHDTATREIAVQDSRAVCSPSSPGEAKAATFSVPCIEPLAQQKHEGQGRNGDCQGKQQNYQREPSEIFRDFTSAHE